MVSRLPVVICGTTQARAGKSASALSYAFAHQSDQHNTLSDLRESFLLLRLLRWFGDMVTGQLIMSTMHCQAGRAAVRLESRADSDAVT